MSSVSNINLIDVYFYEKLKNLMFPFVLQDSPIFDRQDGCEYIFIWRTPAACPIQKNTGGLPF